MTDDKLTVLLSEIRDNQQQQLRHQLEALAL